MQTAFHEGSGFSRQEAAFLQPRRPVPCCPSPGHSPAWHLCKMGLQVCHHLSLDRSQLQALRLLPNILMAPFSTLCHVHFLLDQGLPPLLLLKCLKFVPTLWSNVQVKACCVLPLLQPLLNNKPSMSNGHYRNMWGRKSGARARK